MEKKENNIGKIKLMDTPTEKGKYDYTLEETIEYLRDIYYSEEDKTTMNKMIQIVKDNWKL